MKREEEKAVCGLKRRGLFYFLCGYKTTALSVSGADTAEVLGDILPSLQNAYSHTCTHAHTHRHTNT